MDKKIEKATLGGGCFWCVEAVFETLDGVSEVISGYTGGHSKNPTYKEICGGDTGHAEVVQVHYDSEKISFDQILEVFWTAHDPTTLNRQGNDVGTQYRSSIFYHDEQQRLAAQKSKDLANASGLWKKDIVTEISPLGTFYPAEKYHQGYYWENSNQPYCTFVIGPKLAKVREKFSEMLKTEFKA